MNFSVPKTVSTSQTVAIIGGGFSGTMVAVHLLRANLPLCVKLIERRPEAGRGIAYSTSISTHLLNAPAGKMSALPEQPEHFLQWLQARDPHQPPVLPAVNAATFVPRMVYGDYIQSILSDAITNAATEVRFERVTDEAIAVVPAGSGAVISLNNGGSLYADRVVLATGNFPAQLPTAMQRLEQPQQTVREAWSWDAIADLNSDEPVLLVGTGLTMVDMAVALHQQGHRGSIYAVSRHGLLPQSHQATACHPAFINPETAPRTIRGLLRLIRQEIAVTQNWRGVIDALRPVTQQLWQNLPLAEQQRFLRHLRAYWETHRHRIAPEMAATLAEIMQSGQMVCYAGRIQSCQQSDLGIRVTVQQRGTGQITLDVQRIINCTGTNCNYRRLQNPLITNLQNQQLIRLSTLGLGIDTDPAGAVIDAKTQKSNWLYTLGAPRRGDLWETTAAPELGGQAGNLAQTLLESLAQHHVEPRTESDLSATIPIFRQLFDRESCTYSYLIGSSGYAILVDPVLEQVERDRQVLQELGLTLYACLETHIHADHITGAARLRTLTGCQIIVPENAEVEGADRHIREDEVLALGTVKIQAINTPGHTDSHMAYLINHTHLLTGDALFIRGCGRTDFQGGNARSLYAVVTQKLFALPDETLVYPGHDYQGRTVSTIGEEKRWNPRFAHYSQTEFAQLMNSLNLPYPKKLKQALPANQRCGAMVERSNSEDSEPVESISDLPLFYGMYI
jgi:uncharacterized NAD(P)/FAD-binding protein YdhS/glyoxylase-like metal-dependent hydrolase (beta-lactamase superfamily II)